MMTLDYNDTSIMEFLHTLNECLKNMYNIIIKMQPFQPQNTNLNGCHVYARFWLCPYQYFYQINIY